MSESTTQVPGTPVPTHQSNNPKFVKMDYEDYCVLRDILLNEIGEERLHPNEAIVLLKIRQIIYLMEEKYKKNAR